MYILLGQLYIFAYYILISTLNFRVRGHPGVLPQTGPEYVNGDVVNPRAPQITSQHNDTSRNQIHGATTTAGSHRDPFDMSMIHIP